MLYIIFMPQHVISYAIVISCCVMSFCVVPYGSNYIRIVKDLALPDAVDRWTKLPCRADVWELQLNLHNSTCIGCGSRLTKLMNGAVNNRSLGLLTDIEDHVPTHPSRLPCVAAAGTASMNLTLHVLRYDPWGCGDMELQSGHAYLQHKTDPNCPEVQLELCVEHEIRPLPSCMRGSPCPTAGAGWRVRERC